MKKFRNRIHSVSKRIIDRDKNDTQLHKDMKTRYLPSRRPAAPKAVNLALMFYLAAFPVWACPISGNTVSGDLTVEGDVINLDNGTDQFEFRLGTNRIDFWHDGPGQWVWSQGATPTDIMSLDASNILSLYDLGATSVDPSIVLNPGNPDASPAILPSIMIGGEEVLTESSAVSIGFINTGNIGDEIDSYLLDHSLSLSSGSASSYSSTAMSGGVTEPNEYQNAEYATAMSAGLAIGNYSTAMSGGTAQWDYATAISGGYANGYFSTAMSFGGTDGSYATAMSGGYAYSTADFSTAISYGMTSGPYSVAMSGGGTWGEYSLASGLNAIAESYSSASFGRFNEDGGMAGAWVETDPVLLVGNGTGYANRSNALAVLKNGQTTLTNKAWKENSAAPLEDPASTTDSGGEALVVDGHTVLNGKVIITVAQGDISMGEYQ